MSVDAVLAGKNTLIAEIRAAIHSYILNQDTSRCLELHMFRGGRFVRAIPAGANTEWIGAITKFSFKKQYDGADLDSALTEPIVHLVTTRIAAFFEKHGDSLTEEVAHRLINNPRAMESLAAALLSASGMHAVTKALSAKVMSTLVQRLAHSLSDSLHSQLGDIGMRQLASKTAHSVAAATSKPAALVLAKQITILLKGKLGMMLAKLLTTATFKTVIATAAKKYVVAAIISLFAKTLAAKFGVSGAAAFAWILIPVILAWLAYDLAHFRESLANDVSASVATELSAQFPQLLDNVLHSLEDAATSSDEFYGQLAADLMKTEGASHLLHSLIDALP